MKKQSQNKPNLLNAQMNVTSFITKDYENKSNWTLGENKPNQTQPVVSLSNLFQRHISSPKEWQENKEI